MSHGIYVAPDTWEDELYILALRCPQGVLSHEEALYHYGLTDHEPLQHSITIYTGYGTSRLVEAGFKVFTVKKELFEIVPQVGAQITKGEIMPQAGAQIGEEIVFCIPWGHIKAILDKCKDNKEKALFYVKKTLDNYWSRAVLLNFLDTDLYERQGKAVTNFDLTLPEEKSDLAQAITKDPYNFDFLTIREKFDEKELKDALMDNIGKFLLELGNGFAFVGREVRLQIGETEEYVDMLFYNIKLHCYVVVEVKVEEFNPRDMGQLGTYMVTVNQ